MSLEIEVRLMIGLYFCKDVSSFVDFISGCTVFNCHFGRKIAGVIERFAILVNVSSIVSELW